MIHILFLLLLATPLIATENKPPTIKVLACKLSEKVRLDVEGPFHLTPIDTEVPFSTQQKGARGLLITTEKGLKWREIFPNIFEMRLLPTHEKTILSIDKKPFKGILEIYSIGGTLNLVNEVDIENYLKCHLDDKALQNLSPPALEAVAISARTHLHYIAQRGEYANYQVTLNKTGYPHPQKNKAILDAVEKTRGHILTYKGKTFPTAWSLNSAGETISYSSMFRKAKNAAPLGVTHLPTQTNRERKTWSLSIHPERLLQLINLPDFSQIKLFHAEGTSKVYGIRFQGEQGHKDIDFFHFQQALGPGLLRSNDFTVSLQEGRIIFSGYGEGIGVGLCLTSANAMAGAGSDAAQILKRHYPETTLQKLDCKAIYAPEPPWK